MSIFRSHGIPSIPCYPMLSNSYNILTPRGLENPGVPGGPGGPGYPYNEAKKKFTMNVFKSYQTEPLLLFLFLLFRIKILKTHNN